MPHPAPPPAAHPVPARLTAEPPAVGAPSPARRPLTLWHYLWIVGAAVVLIGGLHWLGPILTPFLVGIILAYLGTPIVDRGEARGVPRALSTLAVVLLFGLVLVALFFVLIPLIQAEVSLAARRVPDLVTAFAESAVPWVEEHFH